MKLHLGCGSVYLQDWLNIDLETPHTFLAKDRPDLVEKWITTEDAYYARHETMTVDTLRDGPLNQDYVCDRFGDLLDPRSFQNVEEILLRQVFEHLSSREADQFLNAAYSILKPSGILRIDVPDHDETVRLLCETHDPFYKRHLLGPRRDRFGYHMRGYTRDGLIDLVSSNGFLFLREEDNIHFYPAFTLRFRK